MNWKEPRAAWSICLLTTATLACLVPFLGKAFHMDDPLFIWTARHIQSHPADFYGFRVNWTGQESSMASVMQNPPLAAYYLAVVGTALGWSENALHFGFLIPALALVIGTYGMARRLCSHPFAAALAVITTPVFLLSSTSLMSDTMMAALWVWAVSFWMDGIEQENPRKLLLAALLMAACSLTKYFGMCLIPLLAAYSAWQKRRAGRWIIYLVGPVLILAAYQWMTARLYGRGLLLDAMDVSAKTRQPIGSLSRIIETMAFSGGCLFIVLPALPLLWGGKGVTAGAAGAAAVGGLMAAMKKVGAFPGHGSHINGLFLLQMALFVVGGAIIVAMAAEDAVRNRTPASILLLLWVAGALFFVGAINWTVSGRNILPLAPAVAVLIVRRLEVRPAGALRHLWWPLGVSLAVALLATWGDWKLAGLAREMASSLTSQLTPQFKGILFEGHWGFQYYMEQLGAKPLDHNDQEALAPNRAIVIPLDNTGIFDLPDNLVEPLTRFRVEADEWISIQSLRSGAGYYSDYYGPAPFLFGPTQPESYWVFRVK